MPGNSHFQTSDKAPIPRDVATFSKNKLEPKVMLWMGISPKGLTKPVLTSGRSIAVVSGVNTAFKFGLLLLLGVQSRHFKLRP